MLEIIKNDIKETNLIKIVNILIDDYISSIEKFKDKVFIYSGVNIKDLLINSKNIINGFKETLNDNLINIVCANDNVDSYKTLTCTRDSRDRSKSDLNASKAILDNIYNIHDKILNIQLIYVLIVYIKKNLPGVLGDELYYYSVVLYTILDNLLFVILKILKTIKIYDKDINKYRYSISIRRFLERMLRVDTIIYSYNITDKEVPLINTDIPVELKAIDLNSKKLPGSLSNLHIDEKSNLDGKIEEIKKFVAKFASIENIANFKDTSVIKDRKDYNTDFHMEYKKIFENDLSILDIKDDDLPYDEYEAMLKDRFGGNK